VYIAEIALFPGDVYLDTHSKNLQKSELSALVILYDLLIES